MSDSGPTAGSSVPAPEVGELLEPFRRPADLPAWNRFAAVNDEFFPIHMDDAAGQRAGYDGAIGMGNLQWSYLHNVLRARFGPLARIVTVECSFRRPARRGTEVVAAGRVVAVDRQEDGQTAVRLDLWVECAGEPIADGTASVLLDAAGGGSR